jgi:hypothetical protein
MKHFAAGGSRRATTLVEMVFFGALGVVVLVGIIGLLSRGSRMLEVSRRASGAQTDLRVFLESLGEDVNELVYLEDGAPFDSATSAADKAIGFVVRSTRYEAGISASTEPTLRRIEYKVGSAPAGSNLRTCSRSVTVLTSGSGAGEQSSRVLVKGLARLRAWPVAAAPQPDRTYRLVSATDPKAREPGATVACLIVDVTMGEPATQASVDQTSVTTVVTKLWCRNRILELGRGGLR